MLKKILFSGSKIEGIFPNLGLLIGRVGIGTIMAFSHGLGKLPPSEGFIAGVAKMGFPLPTVFAWAAGLSEFAGGILLALGLAVKPSSFFLAVTMFVAAFVRHGADPFAKKEFALIYFLIFIVFLCIGGGKFSIDKVIKKD